MKEKKPEIEGQVTTEAIEEWSASRLNECYVLVLYIAGLTQRSTLAIERIRAICELYLSGHYELTVIDLYLQPELAGKAQIVVAPTLVKEVPAPIRCFVGDMSDDKKILQSMNVAT